MNHLTTLPQNTVSSGLNAEDKWYAVAVYARQEKAAQRELDALGFHTFLPLSNQRSLWSDRIKTVRVSLFPGYLFVQTRLDAETRFRLLKPKQVHDLVGKQRNNPDVIAQHIPRSEIESLELLMRANQEVEPMDSLAQGAYVKIVKGPLQGAFGIVQREINGKRRLLVQISLLGRGISTELSVDDVWAVPDLMN